jgi:membrane-associated phospholipid phosphatase
VPKPGLFRPFTDALGDLRYLPSRRNAEWLVAGVALAASAHAADRRVTNVFTSSSHTPYRPGSIVGGTPFELGASFAVYAVARSAGDPRLMSFGSDLIRSQVMAELLTTGLKQSTRRLRPSGSGYSFPSGHTAVTFASATVIQQHFGWKFGVPAYAVATYVGVSRVQMKRHFLSDIAFGAALGIVSGRTVTVGRAHKFMLTPIAAQDGNGVGAGLTWVGKSR